MRCPRPGGDYQFRIPDTAERFEDLLHEAWKIAPDVVFLLPEGNGLPQGNRGKWDRVNDAAALLAAFLRRTGGTFPMTHVDAYREGWWRPTPDDRREPRGARMGPDPSGPAPIAGTGTGIAASSST